MKKREDAGIPDSKDPEAKKGDSSSNSVPKSPGEERPELLGFKRQGMVDWFSPAQLARTGMRAVISALFGSYADKREMQAALDVEDQPYVIDDAALRDTVWIDYVSDLGSGWNSTYSVSYLLGRKGLGFSDDNHNMYKLPRGDVLVMGGDEVYPTATWQEYNNRLSGPYKCSLPHVEENAPILLSIPGNHDWYDGLSSFIKLFCQGRWLGGWQTKQKRSYFALKLPHNWWLWGIDIQLSTDIDKPQLDYFDAVCEQAGKGDNIILCTAEPAWVYQQYLRDDKAYKNLEFFKKRYAGKHSNKLNFRLMLTGDLHHYTSFRNTDDPQTDWKITAGGGGAFSHPTHQIPDSLLLGDKTYTKSAAYPDTKTSRKMAWNNLKFPFINKRFGSFFAVIYVLFAWFTAVSGAGFVQDTTVMRALSVIPDWHKAITYYLGLIGANPGMGVFLFIIAAGFWAFTDRKRKGHVGWSWLWGIIHGLLQVLLMLTAVWLCSRLLFHVGSLSPDGFAGFILFIIAIAVIGWLASGFMMGLYLLAAILVLKTHQTEAFSSFRGEDYKNFIRMRLDREGLTIYPLKVPRAARKWTYRPGLEGEQPWFEPGEQLEYGLIEDPIVIKHKKTS